MNERDLMVLLTEALEPSSFEDLEAMRFHVRHASIHGVHNALSEALERRMKALLESQTQT